jgi:hypothetical protein
MTDAGLPIRTAAGMTEVEAMRPMLEAVSWERTEADPDFFLTTAASRTGTQPYAVTVGSGPGPRAAAVGLLEDVALTTRVGYRAVYGPRVRSLTALHGGVVSTDDEAAEPLIRALDAALAGGAADVLSLPGLKTGSPIHAAAHAAGGVFRRQMFTKRRLHWRLDLPTSYDEFLASLGGSTREGVRRYSKKLEKAYGTDLELRVLNRPSDLERIVHDVDVVAAKTYQRALGVGFADDVEHRAPLELALERGWYKVYVLYVAGDPVAFWPGHTYGRTFFIGIPGYDPAYGNYRVGTYVQMRLIADLCEDPDVDTIDYGLGDAEYKRRFGTENWQEEDIVVFAPSFRGLRINAARTAILGTAQAARWTLEKTGMSDRVKRRWRERLRGSE